MNITIAICCFNSEKVIGKTLQDLRKYSDPALPVIVVDDGSSDATSVIAEGYGAIVIRHSSNLGYGQARQTALENCATDILAFIDDSCLVTEDWFQTLRTRWENAGSNIQSIVGKMELCDPKNRIESFQARHSPFLPLPLSSIAQESFFERVASYLRGKEDVEACYIGGFSNGNASFRVESLKQIGGYDARFKLGAEDENLALRLVRTFGSEAIFYDPEIRVKHESNMEFGSFVRRNYRYGKSSAFRFKLTGGIPTLMPIPTLAILLISIGVVTQISALILLALFLPISYIRRTKNIRYWPDWYLIYCGELAHLFGAVTFLSRKTIEGFKYE